MAGGGVVNFEDEDTGSVLLRGQQRDDKQEMYCRGGDSWSKAVPYAVQKLSFRW